MLCQWPSFLSDGLLEGAGAQPSLCEEICTCDASHVGPSAWDDQFEHCALTKSVPTPFWVGHAFVRNALAAARHRSFGLANHGGRCYPEPTPQ